MDFEGKGELVPVGGGDALPLLRTPLTLGRRESCDICLEFPNVSGKHCELFFKDGFWFVKDLESTNGLKVNGTRVARGGKKALLPTDTLTIGKRSFTIQYVPTDRMAKLEDILEEEADDTMSIPLMEKAGLEKPSRDRRTRAKIDPMDPKNFENEEDDDDF